MEWLYQVVKKLTSSQVVKKFASSHLFWAVTAYLSSVLVDVATANKYIANIMLFIAVMALTQLLMEKLFGVEPPYLRGFLKYLKINRVIGTAENPNQVYEVLKEGSESFKKIRLERIGFMKTFVKWFKINYVPFVSFIVLVLYVLDGFMGWTDKWNLPQEWHYVLGGIIIAIITVGIKSKGFRGLTLGDMILSVIGEYSQSKAQVKAETKAQLEDIRRRENFYKQFGFYPDDLIPKQAQAPVETKQPPLVENAMQPQQPKTRAEMEAMFKKAREEDERNNQ